MLAENEDGDSSWGSKQSRKNPKEGKEYPKKRRKGKGMSRSGVSCCFCGFTTAAFCAIPVSLEA